jgi:hypothetical protein
MTGINVFVRSKLTVHIWHSQLNHTVTGSHWDGRYYVDHVCYNEHHCTIKSAITLLNYSSGDQRRTNVPYPVTLAYGRCDTATDGLGCCHLCNLQPASHSWTKGEPHTSTVINGLCLVGPDSSSLLSLAWYHMELELTVHYHRCNHKLELTDSDDQRQWWWSVVNIIATTDHHPEL